MPRAFHLRAVWGSAGRAGAVMLAATLLFSCRREGLVQGSQPATAKMSRAQVVETAAAAIGKVIRTDAEWKKILTPEQFEITRRKGTEPPFRNNYNDNKAAGIYRCVSCDLDLYSSETKFDSGTGWPSFWAPIAPERIRTAEDNSLFTKRTEVLCNRCDAHLGHIFDDGPPPTGLRHCLNSVALKFVPAETAGNRSP